MHAHITNAIDVDPYIHVPNNTLVSFCLIHPTPPSQECDTWCSIAKVNLAASHNSKTVLDAYRKAYSLAEKGGSAKRQVGGVQVLYHI